MAVLVVEARVPLEQNPGSVAGDPLRTRSSRHASLGTGFREAAESLAAEGILVALEREPREPERKSKPCARSFVVRPECS